MDDGKNYQPAGDSVTFDQDLPRTIYVGLAVTSLNRATTSQAKFTDFVITGL
jgi:hypothetical protein